MAVRADNGGEFVLRVDRRKDGARGPGWGRAALKGGHWVKQDQMLLFRSLR